MKLPSNQVRNAKRETRSFVRANAPVLTLRLGGGSSAGFTMIEIALCLAIIGFALVSILLVLPTGMNTQRENREQTVVTEDASLLIEALRNGARGMDDLTNYVYAITNYVSYYNAQGILQNGQPDVAGYTYGAASFRGGARPAMALTNGLRIVGLLSTPEFSVYDAANPLGTPPLIDTVGVPYTSNHVVAYVHSMSGLAAEKPPQDNQIMQGDAFSYRVLCVNAPMATDTNMVGMQGMQPRFMRELAGNFRELRLMFMWPQLPNANVGGYRQTFRVSIGGQLIVTNYFNYFANIDPLYFYQSQFFTNTP